MEQTPLPPLLSDEDLTGWAPNRRHMTHDFPTTESVRDFYERDRLKTREVVRAMVNDMQDFVDKVDRGQAKSKRSYAAFKYHIEVAKSQLNIEPDQP